MRSTTGAADRADGAAENAAVHADQPGDLLSLDTFYVGKLKGVGKVWQMTGCDAASFLYVGAAGFGDVTAVDVWRFVDTTIRRRRIVAAGWSLQRVLTDGGHEFKGGFVEGCDRRGIRVYATKPRMPGPRLVDACRGRSCMRLCGSQFRRRYFTSRVALQRALDRYLRSTTTSVRIGDYRLKGLTPDQICRGDRGVERARRPHLPRPARAAEWEGCANTITELDS